MRESMTAVINLNHYRKTRNKAEKNTLAARNRVRHGRRNEMAEERGAMDLDGRCLESDGLDDNEPAWDDCGLK